MEIKPLNKNDRHLNSSSKELVLWRILNSGVLCLYDPCHVFITIPWLVSRSSATRFRWSQSYYTAQDEWALDSIYIGQQCPNMCSGHGSCDRGMCRYMCQKRRLTLLLWVCVHNDTTAGAIRLLGIAWWIMK